MKSSRNKYHYQLRRCKRIEEFLKNEKLVQNCFDNNLDIFAELRKVRHNKNEENVCIEGASGKEIPEKFAEVFSSLYNLDPNEEKVAEVELEIEDMISEKDRIEVCKINGYVIQEALGKIKSKKSDPLYDFSSDCLKEAPEILYEYLANLLKSFMIHSHITGNLLSATLVPIVKDKLGDVSSTKNYRSIAISSLILKLIDWVIILNYGHKLKTNDFQFGFQQQSSTSLCSWLAFETIDSYLRKGSTVFGCLLDCTKAFDTVDHAKLFLKLKKAGLPPVVIKLLICIYREQTAVVKWKGNASSCFSIRNGVRQGAVISPLFFSYYMDDLFTILEKTGSGCMIGNYYAGCFGYADDLLFLCPSRKGLQEMLSTAQKYVKEHNIAFSTSPIPEKSKTKGIIFSKKPLKLIPEPLKLNEDYLPWVNEARYLGNTVESVMNDMSKDVRIKRARYIERNVELCQEFPFAHPEVKCQLNKIYNSSFPGSVLYNIASSPVDQIINSWSVSVRQMWGLPFNAHRYLVEELAGEHAHSMLITRFVSFLQNLVKSSKRAVHVMLHKVAGDVSTVTGRNIRMIEELTGNKVDIFQTSIVKLKRYVRYCPIEGQDNWRVNFIKEITNLKQNVLVLENDKSESFMSIDELDEILSFICTS